MRPSHVFCAIALLSALMATSAEAALPTKPFVYRADGKRLSEVLQDFGAAEAVPVVVDAGVEGTVNGEFRARPQEFLTALSKSYDLIWYYDGMTLFVYPSRMIESRVFRMRGYKRSAVQRMLSSLGLGDPRYPLRFNDHEQTLMAYGPPRHIELVQTVIDTLDSSARDKVGASIRVFRLNNAVAADRMAGNVRIPGLATTLNNLFTRGQRGAGGASEQLASFTGMDGSGAGGGNSSNTSKRRALEQTYGAKADASDGSTARRDGVRDAAGRLSTPEAGADVTQSDAPFFQADEATNAIIVRGVPERMPQYQALIRQLDVPQALIEIEATIIDVSNDSFESLGVEWEYTKGSNSFSISPGDSSGNTSIASANITTVVADAGRTLINRIRALQADNKARIVSRPKVLGTANRSAVMTDKRQASVKVAGNLDTSLYTVEAGTTLQVTPQIVTVDGRKEVRMSIYIEDGNFEDTTVDSVPIVKRTEIRTEAALLEGESLLIGGISVDSSSDGNSGVPVLSKIPLLGALFRTKDSSHSQSQRMFLITPKLVTFNTVRSRSGAAPSSTPAPEPAPRQRKVQPVDGPTTTDPDDGSDPTPSSPADSTLGLALRGQTTALQALVASARDTTTPHRRP
jgi:type III secretion protein C